MQIFLTGGTGFVGREILRGLNAAGHKVRALVRRGSEHKLPDVKDVEVHFGDVTKSSSLAGGLTGCDAVIHLVGIIREITDKKVTFKRLHVDATRNLIDAAIDQGVDRFVHMSANGVGPDAKAIYYQTKWAAEERLRASTLDWTILRPSIIFGCDGQFIDMQADLIRKMPVIPVIGKGRYRLQPVAISDVARSFVKALGMPETIGKTYEIGGSESYTYEEILDLTGKAIGKDHVKKLHQPLFMMKTVVKLLGSSTAFPITSDQLTMLLEGNVCDPTDWAETFHIQPLSYAQGVGACFETSSPNQ